MYFSYDLHCTCNLWCLHVPTTMARENKKNIVFCSANLGKSWNWCICANAGIFSQLHVYHLFCWVQLDPSIYESLQKEKVEVGDVIYIEANSGAVKVWSIFLEVQCNWFHLQYFPMFCHLQHGTCKYAVVHY